MPNTTKKKWRENSIQNKQDYFNKLQKIRDVNDWESWLLFMIQALEETANSTLQLVTEIHKEIMKWKQYYVPLTIFIVKKYWIPYSRALIQKLN